MTRLSIPLLLLGTAAACSSNHDIANGEDTSSVTSQTLPTHCETTCQHLVDCGTPSGQSCDCASPDCAPGADCPEPVCSCSDSGPMTMDECVTGCEDAFGDALTAASASCEDAITKLFSCLDAASCTELEKGPDSSCAQAQDAIDGACDLHNDPPPNVTPPSGAGVYCQMGSGVGVAPGGPDAGLVCDESRSGCDDGHEYRISCVDHDGSGTLSCSCIVDAAVQTGFQFEGDCAPMVSDVTMINELCGWSLL